MGGGVLLILLATLPFLFSGGEPAPLVPNPSTPPHSLPSSFVAAEGLPPGFEWLLKNNDLGDWAGDNKVTPNVTVNNGALTFQGAAFTYLTMPRNLRDFFWSFEYKSKGESNSEFIVRIPHQKHKNNGVMVLLKGSAPKHGPSGGISRWHWASTDMVKPNDEWNKVELTVQDERLVVVINGVKVNEANFREPPKDVTVAPEGNIAMAFPAGTHFQIRNMMLKELPPATQSTSTPPAGYVSLLNDGKLPDWETLSSKPIELEVKHGELTSSVSTFSRFQTKKIFRNYTFSVEYKIPDDATVGIELRMAKVWKVDPALSIGLKGMKPRFANYSGSLFKIKKADTNTVTSNDQWNKMVVTLQGDHLVVVNNNVTIHDINIKDYPELHMIQEESPLGLTFHENEKVQLRNFFIKELPDNLSGSGPPPGYVSLIKDEKFTGWKQLSGNLNNLEYKEGALISTGAEYKAFRTEQSYRDYTFTLEYMLPDDGLVGIILRPGKNSLNLGLIGPAPKYKNYSGSLTAIKHVSVNTVTSSEQWNKMEVTLHDDHLVVVSNGVKVQDVNIQDFPNMQQLSQEGPLEFSLPPNSISRLRNFYIKELTPTPYSPPLSADGVPLAAFRFDAATAKQHQQTWADHLKLPMQVENSIGMKLSLIPAGKFRMGGIGQGDSEMPPHEVTLSKPYYMGVYEVKQGEYQKVMGHNPASFVPLTDAPEHPVETVSWTQAVEFCQKLSALPAEVEAGRTYRLPTEAEWEFACRAGTSTWFWSGDELLPEHAACKTSQLSGTTAKVGSYPANPFGLYDMHGNVAEWCGDWFDAKYYSVSPAVDPPGPAAGSQRIMRSGGKNWQVKYCRSINRWREVPESRSYDVGFRVVCQTK